MKKNLKSKFKRNIRLNSLFFKVKARSSNYGICSVKKIDFFLNYSQFTEFNNKCFKQEVINLLDIEFSFLPIFKPKFELIFNGDSMGESFDSNEKLNISISRKYSIICLNSLPIFKRKKPNQNEIFKVKVIFNDAINKDKIFLKEYNDQKIILQQKLPFQDRISDWKISSNIFLFSNGFLEFKKSYDGSTSDFFFQKHLKNKGLVSFNLGPEFRFTFRN